jgi:succinyl-diaminopimelate desuccinylase
MSKVFKEKHVELLQELIKKKSITPIDNGALPLLVSYLKDFNSTLKSFGSSDEAVMNLYSVLERDSNGKNLCFLGHTDVVPPGELNQWKFDPFSATIENSILFGRGTVDMKGAIVAFIAAVDTFILSGNDFGSISFLLTADEEGVAKYGTVKMIEWLNDRNVKIDHCIVGEPVSIEEIGDNIKIGARGSANFILVVYGKQGHVAYSHMVDNPIKRVNRILSDIISYNFSHINTIFDKTNIEITKINSDSGAENIVPNSVEVRFNFRYGSDYNYQQLKEIVENIVKEDAEKYEISSRTSGDAALWLDSNSHFINLAKDSIRNITSIEPSVGTYGGTSDGRFIRKYCEAIEIGLVGNTAHQINERVPLKDLETLANIYLEILNNYFKFS